MLCQSIAVYLHLAECAISQTHLPLLFLAFLFSKLLKGEFDARMQTQSAQKNPQTLFTIKTFSQPVSASHSLDLFLSFCLFCQSLSLSPPPAFFLSPPHTHLSFILYLLFIVFFFGSACPPKGPLFLSLSQMFFLLLGLFLCPLSFAPPRFCAHLIFHLNTFSVSLPHTHMPLPLS